MMPRDSFNNKSQGSSWQPEAKSDGKKWVQAIVKKVVKGGK